MDFPRLTAVLREAGFGGPYSLELESPGVADGSLPKETSEAGIWSSIAYLRRIGQLPAGGGA